MRSCLLFLCDDTDMQPDVWLAQFRNVDQLDADVSEELRQIHHRMQHGPTCGDKVDPNVIRGRPVRRLKYDDI
jgi:hypothetical protein